MREIVVQIILTELGKLESREADQPRRTRTEALVRIGRVRVCGSDSNAFAGTHPAYSYPRIFGQEMSCEVKETPSNRNRIRPGDLCAVDPKM